MNTVNVTLDEILKARDARAAAQRRLLKKHGRPLVSFTMNIPGPVKKTPLSEFAFDAGLDSLYDALGMPAAQETIRPHTGCEALLVYDRDAAGLKQSCLYIEAASPVGRLYDMDVLDTDGQKLSRPSPRTCLVCGRPVTACSRSRAHGLDAVVNAANGLLEDFAAESLADMAAASLIDEVELTPKPGLVDRRSNGAHTDMDAALFYRSVSALRPYFAEAVRVGISGASAAQLRELGMEAEAAMFDATGGINTHKGALYSFSLLLAALGRCLGGKAELNAGGAADEVQAGGAADGTAEVHGNRPDADAAEALANRPDADATPLPDYFSAMFSEAAKIAADLSGPEDNQAPESGTTPADAKSSESGLTHGQQVLRRYGAGGVRAEAAKGFPTAREAARRLASQTPLSVLLWLMTVTEDSNLYYRGGREGVDFVRSRAQRILDAPAGEREKLAEALDEAMTEKRLSPGGCADLLAVAMFIRKVCRQTF